MLHWNTKHWPPWSCVFLRKPLSGERFMWKTSVWLCSLIFCRIPVLWRMLHSCQRFSSGGSLGKTVLHNPIIFRPGLSHYSNSLHLFTIICVLCWRLSAWIISSLSPQACCERISPAPGSRGPVDPEGGGHLRADHGGASAGLDNRVRQTSKVINVNVKSYLMVFQSEELTLLTLRRHRAILCYYYI